MRINHNNTAETGETLPTLFHQHPAWTYKICQEWGYAHEGNAAHDWAYVVGLLDGINSTHHLDPESANNLHFLAVLARHRMVAVGMEVKP